MSDQKVKAKQHESYITFTIIAFLLPVVGVILGVAYLTKDTKLDKKLGEHLVAISVLFMIVWGGLFGAYLINQANNQFKQQQMYNQAVNQALGQ